ncbi:hypothetical protein [Tardiphaga sp.]|jgi:hypothetical protein|uniref:hypothetical protein n=1 Tax=Tardiphaga sp. TaxID=1926292 RepID=UPI0037D9BCA3
MQFSRRKRTLGLLMLAIAAASAPTTVSAITLDVARKCEAATSKAFPPRVPGNPAAGSAAGSGADQRAYYSKCVADEEAAQGAGKADSTNKPAAPAK